MKSVIDILDLSVEEINDLIATACDIIDNPDKYAEACKRKKLATLFFEPSTRTRLSFEAAMLELGGSVIGFSAANNSSAAKGESVADTVKTISCYADIIAMRHPKEGAALVAATLQPSKWLRISIDSRMAVPAVMTSSMMTISSPASGT